MSRDLTVDQRESQRRSVVHLQGLYSVVVALALTLAAERLFPVEQGVSPSRAFVLATALLVTLIPFYHGALRHLDELYGRETGQSAHPFSVLVDFLLLFLESCVLLAMAASITQEPNVFAWLFLALLTLDVIWAYLTTTFLVPGRERVAQKTWLKVNVSYGLALLAILVVVTFAGWASSGALPYAVLVVALARTATDYALSWKFYVAAPAK
jgi:hypothetical protein